VTEARYDPTRVLTLAEAARYIRVSKKTLREIAKQKRIPSQKVGREWRFFLPALDAWLTGGDRPTAAEAPAPYEQQTFFEADEQEIETPRVTELEDSAFTRNRAEPLHRWVPWIAGFSAQFVGSVLDRITYHAPDDVLVLDPFAGVGTTLVEGLKRGHNVVGFEINPYAALACRVKLQAHTCSPDELPSCITRFREHMRTALRSSKRRPASRPPAAFLTRKAFFSPSVERQVLFVLDYIEQERNATLKDIFRIALGAVMVSFSNYSYEPSLSTRAAAGREDISEADVTSVLAQKLYEMSADICFLQRQVSHLRQEPSALVYEGSFLKDHGAALRKGSVDVLITSPPYLNNYHYVRNTRPQLHWLGLIDSTKTIKQMELDSFGTFWQTVRAGPEIGLDFENAQLAHTLSLIRAQNPHKGVYGGKGWANYAAVYFNDCNKFLTITRNIMKPGGLVVVVIGNNILQAVEVKTEEILARMAESTGFRVLGMHVVRKRRTGTSIVNSTVRAGVTSVRTELYETAVELQAPH
jgi:excisionase family DNA binding protein